MAMSTFSIPDLPWELQLHIASYLNFHDTYPMTFVSHAWRNTAWAMMEEISYYAQVEKDNRTYLVHRREQYYIIVGTYHQMVWMANLGYQFDYQDAKAAVLSHNLSSLSFIISHLIQKEPNGIKMLEDDMNDLFCLCIATRFEKGCEHLLSLQQTEDSCTAPYDVYLSSLISLAYDPHAVKKIYNSYTSTVLYAPNSYLDVVLLRKFATSTVVGGSSSYDAIYTTFFNLILGNPTDEICILDIISLLSQRLENPTLHLINESAMALVFDNTILWEEYPPTKWQRLSLPYAWQIYYAIRTTQGKKRFLTYVALEPFSWILYLIQRDGMDLAYHFYRSLGLSSTETKAVAVAIRVSAQEEDDDVLQFANSISFD